MRRGKREAVTVMGEKKKREGQTETEGEDMKPDRRRNVKKRE